MAHRGRKRRQEHVQTDPEVTEARVAEILSAPKSISSGSWQKRRSRGPHVPAYEAKVLNDLGLPLKFIVDLNLYVPGLYSFQLFWGNRRIHALDGGREHRPVGLYHMNVWHDTLREKVAVPIPWKYNDPTDAAEMLRQYLAYLNIAYDGTVPWSPLQTTLEGGMLLDELLDSFECDQ